jgi:hypothetical protein
MNKKYIITDSNDKLYGFGFTRKSAIKQAEQKMFSMNPDTDEFPALKMLICFGTTTLVQHIEL